MRISQRVPQRARHARVAAAVSAALALGVPVTGAASPERAKDPDRPTWLWVDTEAGAASVALKTFELDPVARTAGLVERDFGGPTLGIGLGPRLFVFRLGPRARAGFLDRGDYYTIGGELGLHIPISIVEPHFDLGAGYAVMSDMEMAGADDRVSITGYYARATGGLDVKLSRGVSLGANASYEMALLTPPGTSIATLQDIRKDALAEDFDKVWAELPGVRGSSYGGVVSVMGVLGLHY